MTAAFGGDAGRDADVVRAAGGVVIGGDGRLGVVHRPRYDDWSLPKGKLFAGEDPLDGALREVEEETGFRCVAGPFLDRISYPDRHGRPKVVDYWLLEPVDRIVRRERRGGRAPLDGTRGRRGPLTYERDREMARKGVEAWRASHT